MLNNADRAILNSNESNFFQIGLMRGGYFLAEESPDRLMQQFGVESLEEVFLKLSVMQNRGKRRRSSIVQVVTETITVPSGQVNDAAILDDENGEISGEFGDNVSTTGRSARRVSIVQEDPHMLATDVPPEEEVQISWKDRLQFCKGSHMRALVWKNGLWMLRNIPILSFLIGLPMAQVILFCLAIGKDPINLDIAVTNKELDHFTDACKFVPGCNTSKLSCNYISYLEKQDLITVRADHSMPKKYEEERNVFCSITSIRWTRRRRWCAKATLGGPSCFSGTSARP